jgi:serine/threonine protein kinase
MFQVKFKILFYFFLFFLESLEKFIDEYKEKSQNIPIKKIKSIVMQLLTGLKYVHEKSINKNN